MNELEKRLKVIANRENFQEAEINRPYFLECDTVKYPSKFKATMLRNFDDRGSLNQYIYFKLHTENVVSK